MSEGELESWIVVMDWMGWNNFLTCIHLFLMKVWMRKKISKIKAVTDIFFHYRSVCWFLFLDWSWLQECQKIEEVIKLFVLLLFFQLKLKYWKGCLLALIKMNTIMLLLRPLRILEMGMIVLGFVLLLLLLTVQNKTKVDPLFYGTTRQTLL